jgi:hypothetical protein
VLAAQRPGRPLSIPSVSGFLPTEIIDLMLTLSRPFFWTGADIIEGEIGLFILRKRNRSDSNLSGSRILL